MSEADRINKMSSLTTTWISNAFQGESVESDIYTKEQLDRATVNTRADVAGLMMHAIWQTVLMKRIKICAEIIVVIEAARLLIELMR